MYLKRQQWSQLEFAGAVYPAVSVRQSPSNSHSFPNWPHRVLAECCPSACLGSLGPEDCKKNFLRHSLWQLCDSNLALTLPGYLANVWQQAAAVFYIPQQVTCYRIRCQREGLSFQWALWGCWSPEISCRSITDANIGPERFLSRSRLKSSQLLSVNCFHSGFNCFLVSEGSNCTFFHMKTWHEHLCIFFKTGFLL